MTYFTNQALRSAVEKELNRLTANLESASAKDACNIRKAITATNNMSRLLDACGERFEANSEVYTADRDFELFNYGTVAEQALFFLYTRRNSEKSEKIGFDHTIKRAKCEFKACLSHSSKNTAYKPNDNGRFADVLLVNAVGVFYIPAEYAVTLVDSRGRFNPVKDYADYVPEARKELCEVLTMKIYGEEEVGE